MFTEKPLATRKLDGEACAIIHGRLYRRYDFKKSKTGILPEGAIACQEQPDIVTGSFPHWIPATYSNATILNLLEVENPIFDNNSKYLVEAAKNLITLTHPTELGDLDGTYEICGPHYQGNPEKLDKDTLIKHGSIILEDFVDYSFEGIRTYLQSHDMEGIVFYRSNGEMVKIKKSDFGFFWKEDTRNKSLKSKSTKRK